MVFFRSTMVRIHVSTSCFHAELCTQKKVQGGGVEEVSNGLKKFQFILRVFYLPVGDCKQRIIIQEENGVFL